MEHKKWDAVDLARELVQKESTNPGTYEEAVGRLVERYLVSAGVQPDDSEVLPGRRNIRAVLPGRASHPRWFLSAIWIRLWKVPDGIRGHFQGR